MAVNPLDDLDAQIFGPGPAAAPVDDDLDSAIFRPPSSLARRALADPLVSAAKGVVGLGEAAVGLANLPTLGRAGKLLEEHAGYDPKRTQEILEGLYSEEQQAANRAVAEAKGVGGKISTLARNPSVIPHKLVETLPLLAGGGAVARIPALASRLTPLARGAIGEGVVGAGLSAEQIRQGTETGVLTPGQAALATGTGIITGAITRGSGALANRLGIGDVEQLFAGGTRSAGQARKGVVRRTAQGALVEGVLEEAPQSAQEQILQNVALDKPALEGVPEATALGGVLGSVMGGGIAALPQAPQPLAQPGPQGRGAFGEVQDEPFVPSAAPSVPPAPSGPVSRALGTASSQVLPPGPLPTTTVPARGAEPPPSLIPIGGPREQTQVQTQAEITAQAEAQVQGEARRAADEAAGRGQAAAGVTARAPVPGSVLSATEIGEIPQGRERERERAGQVGKTTEAGRGDRLEGGGAVTEEDRPGKPEAPARAPEAQGQAPGVPVVGVGAVGQALSENAHGAMVERVQRGQEVLLGQNQNTRAEVLARARANPEMNLRDNADGTVTVVGARDRNTGAWVGTGPTATKAEQVEAQTERVARGMEEGAHLDTVKAVAAGQERSFRRQGSIAAARADPDLHLRDNPDGSVTVIGARDRQKDRWVGVAPGGARPASEKEGVARPAGLEPSVTPATPEATIKRSGQAGQAGGVPTTAPAPPPVQPPPELPPAPEVAVPKPVPAAPAKEPSSKQRVEAKGKAAPAAPALPKTDQTKPEPARYSRTAARTLGQAPGLFEKPDVPVTELSGSELTANRALGGLRVAAESKLRSLDPGALKNDETEWIFSIGRQDWKKMARTPGQTAISLQAIGGIESLARHAVLAESHLDRKGNPDVMAVHRFYTPVQIGDHLFRAKLTVREYARTVGGKSKNLHALETVEIESPDGIRLALRATQGAYPPAQPSGPVLSIADLLRGAVRDSDGQPFAAEDAGAKYSYLGERGAKTDTLEFKRWFKQSKIVDRAGEPLVAYHVSAVLILD